MYNHFLYPIITVSPVKIIVANMSIIKNKTALLGQILGPKCKEIVNVIDDGSYSIQV